MRKQYLALVLLSAVLLKAPAAHADTTTDAKTDTSYQSNDNGGYTAKERSESTDANGTTTEHSTTKKVDVDNNGNTTTTVDTKSSIDPKGLMNKTTVETKNKSVEKDGGTSYTHTKTVNGKTVEKTKDSSDTTTSSQ